MLRRGWFVSQNWERERKKVRSGDGVPVEEGGGEGVPPGMEMGGRNGQEGGSVSSTGYPSYPPGESGQPMGYTPSYGSSNPNVGEKNSESEWARFMGTIRGSGSGGVSGSGTSPASYYSPYPNPNPSQ